MQVALPPNLNFLAGPCFWPDPRKFVAVAVVWWRQEKEGRDPPPENFGGGGGRAAGSWPPSNEVRNFHLFHRSPAALSPFTMHVVHFNQANETGQPPVHRVPPLRHAHFHVWPGVFTRSHAVLLHPSSYLVLAWRISQASSV